MNNEKLNQLARHLPTTSLKLEERLCKTIQEVAPRQKARGIQNGARSIQQIRSQFSIVLRMNFKHEEKKREPPVQ